MKAQAGFLGVLTLSATLGLALAQDRPARKAGDGPASTPERAADVRAIGDLLGSFVKAYNAKDASALGGLFTADAEIEDEEGDVTRGRDAIVARFSGYFAGGESGILGATTDSLRFLGTDLAIEDGTTSTSMNAGAPPRTNRCSVIYVRQGGRWLQARVRDEQPDEDSPRERLQDLGWMIGEWINESDDETVLTTCKWSADGNFLLRDFDVNIEGRVALSGTQRIGWDAQRKQFRMWVFDTKGGFAEGLLSHEGDRWVVKGTGVRSDGRSVSATTVITILGKDRLRWEISDRTLGGVAVPGTDQFTVVRRPPPPGN